MADRGTELVGADREGEMLLTGRIGFKWSSQLKRYAAYNSVAFALFLIGAALLIASGVHHYGRGEPPDNQPTAGEAIRHSGSSGHGSPVFVRDGNGVLHEGRVIGFGESSGRAGRVRRDVSNGGDDAAMTDDGYNADNDELETREYVDRKKRADRHIYKYGAARMFLAIPYVTQPDGTARFQRGSPLPPKDPNKLQDNEFFGPPCPQYFDKDHQRVVGAEDCLHLNIFTPRTIPDNVTYPVFVYFHGGDLVRGSSAELGINGIVSQFVHLKVIVVTANYRLGALGLYQFGDGGTSGVDNLRSLWDQLDALRYVHENIDSYGGDPKRVTVGGHDASACTLAYLALVALNRENKFADGLPLYDLFQRMILQSGSINYCRQYIESPSAEYRKNRCVGELSGDEEKCMRDSLETPEGYVAPTNRFPLNWKLELPHSEDAEGMFLQPRELMKNVRISSADIQDPTLEPKTFLIGYAQHDATGIYGYMNDSMREAFFKTSADDFFTFDSVIAVITQLYKSDGDRIDVSDGEPEGSTPQAFYRGKLLPLYLNRFGLPMEPVKTDSTLNDRREIFHLALTEAFFAVSAVRMARRFASFGQNVHLYRFNRPPPAKLVKPSAVRRMKESGRLKDVVPFGAELPYLFLQDRYWAKPDGIDPTLEGDEQEFAEAMAQAWSTFISHGQLVKPDGGSSYPGLFNGSVNGFAENYRYVQLGASPSSGGGEPLQGEKFLFLRSGDYLTQGVEELWVDWGIDRDSDLIKGVTRPPTRPPRTTTPLSSSTTTTGPTTSTSPSVSTTSTTSDSSPSSPLPPTTPEDDTGLVVQGVTGTIIDMRAPTNGTN